MFLRGDVLAARPFPGGLVPDSLLAPAVTVFLIASILWLFSRYNGLVRARKRVEEAWSGIDVQLRRRASLLPNLEEVVKGYAAHERGIFEEVARARGALQKAGGASEAAGANDAVGQALVRMFAVAENYPQLRASENFIALRADLSDVEEKVALARQFYNRNVLDYNTRLDTYPDAIIASNFAFAPAEFFETEPETRSDVRMTFTKQSAA
jgi:LemA protein